jgi:chemotaxis protein CheD
MAAPSPDSSARKRIIVGIADMAVTNDITVDLLADLVTHSLGSCLGITIYDPETHVGGLLHVMLPDSAIDPEKAKRSPCVFVDTGVPLLFHKAYELGAEKTRIVVKVVGGARLLNDFFKIGQRNYEALVTILTRNGVKITAEQVGGQVSRTIRLDVKTGSLFIRTPGLAETTL